jgi:hypothetical protein
VIAGLLRRRGRTVLVRTAAALFVVMIVAAVVPPIPGLGLALLLLTGVVAVAFLALPFPVRTDALVVGNGTFTVPGDPGLVLMGLAHLGLIAATFVLGVHDDARAAWLVMLLVVTAPLALYAPGLWSGLGVTLDPEGVRARKQSGILLFPWDALAAEQPAPDPDGTIILGLDRPDLVTRTGWPLDTDRLPPHEVLAAAIRYYAAHPGERAGIGTAEGYQTLSAAIEAAPALPRRTRGAHLRRDVITGATVVLAAGALFLWTNAAFGGHGLVNVLPPLLALPAFVGFTLILNAVGTIPWGSLHPSRLLRLLRRPDPPDGR